jgi:isoprenylcysteine carboxyl methyltransferase (ICMT) family protein YpbQ
MEALNLLLQQYNCVVELIRLPLFPAAWDSCFFFLRKAAGVLPSALREETKKIGVGFL